MSANLVEVTHSPTTVEVVDTGQSGNLVEVTQSLTTVEVVNTGEVGPRGEGLVSYTLEADSNIAPGMALYINNSGNIERAIANATSTSSVAGLSTSITNLGGGCQYKMEGLVELTDWSNAIENGASTLSAGSFYYVSSTDPGKITTTAPSGAGNFVVQVGFAQSTTKLNLQIQPPIKLS